MKRWDKIYYIVSTPLFFVMFILSIFDATRFSGRASKQDEKSILGYSTS